MRARAEAARPMCRDCPGAMQGHRTAMALRLEEAVKVSGPGRETPTRSMANGAATMAASSRITAPARPAMHSRASLVQGPPLRRTGSCTVATTFSNQVGVWRATRSCLWERSAFASSWPKPAQLRQRQAVPSGHQRAPRAITGASYSLDHRRLDVELREPGSARLCLLKGTRTREGRNVYLTVISQASNRHPSGWRGARKLAGQRPSALSQRSSQSKAAMPCHLCSPSKMSIAILSSTPSS